MPRRLCSHWVYGVVLIILTAISWRYRFEISPHPVNEQTLAATIREDPKNARARNLKVLETKEGPLIQIGREAATPKYPLLILDMPNSSNCPAILIRFDYRFQKVIPGPASHHRASAVFCDQRGDEPAYHPGDSLLFSGIGSQDWRRMEIIRQLPGTDYRSFLHLGMLGKRGLIEVRNFSIAKVRERNWFPFASFGLSILWFRWTYLLIKTRSKPSHIRRLIATSILFLVSWITIFPQTNTLFFPFFGEFNVGERPEIIQKPSPPDAPESTPQISVHPVEPIKPSGPATLQPPNSPITPLVEKPILPPPPPNTPEVARRELAAAKITFHNIYKVITHQRQWLHLPAYFLFTLIILSLTGKNRAILLVCCVGLFSELVPPAIRYGYNSGDLLDFIFNFIGIGLAYLVWLMMPYFWNHWIARRLKTLA